MGAIEGAAEGHHAPRNSAGYVWTAGATGRPQTPDTQAAEYGSGNLLALAVWAVQHVKNKITDHALELAATATGGEHLSTFKKRSLEQAVDEIGANCMRSIR